MQFFVNPHFRFMRYRRLWLAISLAMLVLGWLAYAVRGGLNLGIDFAGGTQLTLRFREAPDLDRLRQALAAAGIPQTQLQSFGRPENHEILLKTPLQDSDDEEQIRQRIDDALTAEYNAGSTGFDLNQRGTVALGELLARLDPDGVGGDPENRRAHYEAVAETIGERRRSSGILDSWQDLAGLPEVSAEVVEALRQNAVLGNYTVLGGGRVSPQVGAELRQKGILAVVFSLIGMLVYIWLRFEMRFGIGAVVSVAHDVFVTLPLFALTGFEFNLTTVAAFLTLIGYSVNDSVVIFDRVREIRRHHRRKSLEEVLDLAINQTLSRTILTGGATLLATLSLFFFGGEVLRGFAFILAVGIILGTYSTIYIASPITLWWDQVFGKAARAERKERRAAL